MELVTGASGFVGGRLIERLVAEGRPVRALARDPSVVATRASVESVRGDVLTGAGFEAEFDACFTAYYLVHSMESAAVPRSAWLDRRAAV